ncbi:MAG TPA: MFS transporter [Sphingomonadaceae bacterium]|nr:MFS transporter [Sphingomonadaceae bacterium]
MTPIRTPRRSPAAIAILLAGILLIGANLRGPFTSVAPLLDILRATFSLTRAQAGMLTTLPLLTFAIVSPFSARLARAYGLERALMASLILIAGGIAIRSAGAVWPLYLGTLLLGVGIAVGNVLLPSLVKRDFPNNIATLTAAYVVAMGVAAAIASALVVPLERLPTMGWRSSLGAAIILPLATILLWLPQVRSDTKPGPGAVAPGHGGHVWRSALAWQVTAFMGLNSVIYYVIIAWLPAILADHGYSAGRAGTIHGVLQLAGALAGLFIGVVVKRSRSQRTPAALAALLTTLAFAGLLIRPEAALWWMICFGTASGMGIILSLIFFGLRTHTPEDAATLSGMAQSVGYLLAAVGPPVAGLLHDGFGGWRVPLLVCLGLSLLMLVAGILAGRPLRIGR